MRYFPTVEDRPASDALIDRAEAAFETDGFGLWAVERIDDQQLIGFVGLHRPSFEAAFTPSVEIG